MTMSLDLVPSHGGTAAIILKHFLVSGEGAPILVAGEPGQVIAVREKIRHLLEEVQNPRRKARKKVKVTPTPEKAPEAEAPTKAKKKKRVPNLTKEQKQKIREIALSPMGKKKPTFAEIAAEVGATEDQVLRFLDKGAPPVPAGETKAAEN